MKRLAAKAKELGIGIRTIERRVSAYEAEGEVGLLSANAVRSALGSTKFALFEQTASDIMREYTDLSKPTMDLIINHSEARLNATYGKGAVRLPSPATAYRILEMLELADPLADVLFELAMVRPVLIPVGPYAFRCGFVIRPGPVRTEPLRHQEVLDDLRNARSTSWNIASGTSRHSTKR
jgi:hypothetical protein